MLTETKQPGSTETALDYCEQALALATELGISLAEECRKLKAELEGENNNGT